MRPENRGFAKFIAIPALGLIALAAAGCDSGGPSEPEAKNAAEAAAVGDTVTVKWPASTVMCSERNDASKVYLVGENALRQTWRVENSAMKAVQAKSAAQKLAMSQAYSCEWAPNDRMRFVVKQKEIIGNKSTAYYTADYCLKKEVGGEECWWIIERADMGPPIKRVARAPDNKL
ncbi:hypothetical protein [Bradyrhizobium cytisi]|uniref:Uncharacterized protein n=1 Tax=Bradyrhizobium cytisi TaxID=515489 RepID=A0A5S4WA08_9BRAD|nr:hypothetical protein [Bradyrhizobium cytisi]TYL70956.1 hypothetical protein FXB38_40855 [Bradyrhizobium cytisi]